MCWACAESFILVFSFDLQSQPRRQQVVSCQGRAGDSRVQSALGSVAGEEQSWGLKSRPWDSRSFWEPKCPKSRDLCVSFTIYSECPVQ